MTIEQQIQELESQLWKYHELITLTRKNANSCLLQLEELRKQARQVDESENKSINLSTPIDKV